MIEKHYGDARVDAVHLDEMIGALDPSTRNPPGTLSVAPDRASTQRTKKPPTLVSSAPDLAATINVGPDLGRVLLTGVVGDQSARSPAAAIGRGRG